MRYVVKVTCFFDNRYFKKGETVDFPSAVTPPDHFELIDKPVEKPKAEADEPKKDEPKKDEPKKDEPKKSRMAKAKAKRNG